jgi:hypothetical protein
MAAENCSDGGRHRLGVLAVLSRGWPMLTVVQRPGRSQSTRRVGWRLGDGKTTLRGLSRDRWVLPERRARARPCDECQRTADPEPKPRKIGDGLR